VDLGVGGTGGQRPLLPVVTACCPLILVEQHMRRSQASEARGYLPAVQRYASNHSLLRRTVARY